MVQRHAARFALNKFDRYVSITEMINLLRWLTLENRRNTMRTEMLYKIMNNLVDYHLLYSCENFLRKLPCRVDACVYSFFSTRNQIMEHFTPVPNRFS